MDFDRLLVTLFGTDQPADLSQDEFAAGADRLLVQLGLERDAGRRFALWSIAYMLNVAPDVDAVFERQADRDAACAFMNTVDAAEPEDS